MGQIPCSRQILFGIRFDMIIGLTSGRQCSTLSFFWDTEFASPTSSIHRWNVNARPYHFYYSCPDRGQVPSSRKTLLISTDVSEFQSLNQSSGRVDVFITSLHRCPFSFNLWTVTLSSLRLHFENFTFCSVCFPSCLSIFYSWFRCTTLRKRPLLWTLFSTSAFPHWLCLGIFLGRILSSTS